jgi:hypothetical protein
MPNASPFEIRLELLKMAKEMLEQEYFQKVQGIDQKYGFEIEEAHRTGKPIPDRKILPYPTEQDVIRKADALNAFVSSK